MPDRLSEIMTPAQEQAAMQFYVRQRLGMTPQDVPGQQSPYPQLQMPQQPLGDYRGEMMPPPTLPGTAPRLPPGVPPEPTTPGSYGVGMGPQQIDVSRPSGGPPGVDFQGNLAGNRLGDARRGAQYAVPDVMLRKSYPF